MEKNIDYNNFYGFSGYPPQYSPYENIDPTSSPESNFFNPMFQYEQGYMYYRYLTQALEYKMKCKEYEKLSSKDSRNDRRVD